MRSIVPNQKGLRHTLLNFWVTSGEVVEALSARLSTVHGKGEVMILEVEADTWEVDDGSDSGLPELLGVALS